METRRLTRSDRERMLGGVCGGLAEYFTIDPTLVRLAFVFLTLAGMQGVWIYIILLILMPLEPQPGAVPPPTAAPPGVS
jgi:phage shock protein C